MGKKTERLTVSLPSELKEELMREAERVGVSMSVIVKWALKARLRNEE